MWSNCVVKPTAEAFELYSVHGEDLRLIAGGTKAYESADASANREERSGKFYGVRRLVELEHGFAIQLVDTLDKNVTGFGLSVVEVPIGSRPNGLSWEWYKRAQPNASNQWVSTFAKELSSGDGPWCFFDVFRPLPLNPALGS